MMDIRQKLKESQTKLNAVVTIIKKEETNDGILKNIPIALKDNISTKGTLTTACSKILDNYIPVFDSTVVKKLKGEGADLVCKTNMDELAMGGSGLNSYFGATHNPYDYDRVAGGSSSGSAALVGSHILNFAIGTDTGDSVRKPSAYCGCVGFKPTYGLISRYGVIPYASSLDHVAYFTDTVEQSALLLNVLSGRDDRDLTSLNVPKIDYTNTSGNIDGKVFGVIDEILESKTEDKYKSIFLNLLKTLEDNGAIIKHFSIDLTLLNSILTTYEIIANCEATSNHSNLDGIRFGHRIDGDSYKEIINNSRTEGLGPLSKRRFILGAYALDDLNQKETFRKAQQVRRILVEKYRKILNECDAVILPTADKIAPKIDEIDKIRFEEAIKPINNHLILANFAGNPSISIPLSIVDNCPVAVNLSGKILDEKKLLSYSKGIEKIINFKKIEKEYNPWSIL